MVKKKVFRGSWQTTVAGLCGALALVFREVSHALDSDPGTLVSIEDLFFGVSFLFMGWRARDNNVTSKQVMGAED
jgi:hypothetical protein